MSRFEHIRRALYEEPWAIIPSKLAAMIELVELRFGGEHLSAEEIVARVGTPNRPGQSVTGGVAVIPVYGVLCQHMGMMEQMSGGTSTDQLAAQIRQAVADPSVGALVLDCDSPGGNVYGIQELGALIAKARDTKPIVAVANSLMASAAYWLGSQASELVVTPGGDVGSIGVLAMHADESQALEQAGVRVTTISAGRYKTELSPYAPLSDEARAAAQQRVDEIYGAFTAAVASGRGVPVEQVRSGMGEGRVVGAKQAMRMGMADRVATLDDTVARLQSGRARVGGRGGSAVFTGLSFVAGPIPPHTSSAIAPDDAPWDGPGEVAKAEGATELRRMHAWVDDAGDPDAKSSYKIPHHRADGTLVPRGLFAAAGRLDQTDIPAGDVPGVKEHLQKHYDELPGDREAPWESTPDGDDGDDSSRAAADLDLRRRRRRLRVAAAR